MTKPTKEEISAKMSEEFAALWADSELYNKTAECLGEESLRLFALTYFHAGFACGAEAEAMLKEHDQRDKLKKVRELLDDALIKNDVHPVAVHECHNKMTDALILLDEIIEGEKE